MSEFSRQNLIENKIMKVKKNTLLLHQYFFMYEFLKKSMIILDIKPG